MTDDEEICRYLVRYQKLNGIQANKMMHVFCSETDIYQFEPIDILYKK